MTRFIAIANRKGGVGKSTIACLMAHSFATWAGKCVLMVDLDSQANTSLIMIGGTRWVKARDRGATVADYFVDNFKLFSTDAAPYLVGSAGDVLGPQGTPAPISLLPGSLEVEERERVLLHGLARDNRTLPACEDAVRARLKQLLRRLGDHADIVLMDCPPGISLATDAALELADQVIVPFRPDYVSLFAVDRIARMIQQVPSFNALHDVPKEARRYVAVANFYRRTAVHDRLIEEIGVYHPMLATRVPQSIALSNAFDWDEHPRTMADKYGEAIDIVRTLFGEVLGHVNLTRAAGGAAA